MLPVGISTRRLNNLINELRSMGIWAERHSYSIRVMYRDKIVASLHLYPGFNTAVLRLYGDKQENDHVLLSVTRSISKHLPGFKIEVYILRH
ncbi:MAG: hypothetical protein QXE81_06425 [Desulfurococcaceae archaeon]